MITNLLILITCIPLSVTIEPTCFDFNISVNQNRLVLDYMQDNNILIGSVPNALQNEIEDFCADPINVDTPITEIIKQSTAIPKYGRGI
jgi:hypothetical protein